MRARLRTVLRGMAVALLLGGCEHELPPGEARLALAEGWRQYSAGGFEGAIAAFKQATKASPPNSEQQLQALYGEATVWDLRRPGEDPARAAEMYRKVIAAGPQSDFAGWSLLALARMQELVPVGQEPQREAARAGYQRVIDSYPAQLAAEEAFIYQQVDRLRSFDSADARTALPALEGWVAAHPQARFAAAAHQLLAECHRMLGQPDERVAEEIAALELREATARALWKKKNGNLDHFVDPTTAGAVFKIARLAEFEAGDFALARQYYRRFLDENPTEKRSFMARQSLERMDRTGAELRGTPPPQNPS